MVRVLTVISARISSTRFSSFLCESGRSDAEQQVKAALAEIDAARAALPHGAGGRRMNRPKLRTLKPNVRMLETRVRVLTVNAGATPRLSDKSGHAWAKIRAMVLAEEPLCRVCQAKSPPRVSASTEVDHIVALEDGGAEERANLCGICRACHAEKTSRENRARWAKR
jgi:hypothetical protein